MTDKNLNLANSALRLVVAYDDLMRQYTGPVSDLTRADNAAIDEAYDQMVAAARITLDVTSRTIAPAPEKHVELLEEAMVLSKIAIAAEKMMNGAAILFAADGETEDAKKMTKAATIMGEKARSLASKLAAADPSPQPNVAVTLEEYFERQIEWSRETFGPALRTGGVIDHIRKELREIEADPHDLSEWVDVVILAMDGFWRHGGKASDLLPGLLAKQRKNMARMWPDWRTMSENSAIEHDRSHDVPTTEQTK